MGLLKNLTLSALLLSKLLFSNPGTKITSYGDVGIKFNKNTTDIKEVLSLTSNSNAGFYLECDEVPKLKLNAYFSTNNEFKPTLEYELYDDFQDSTNIQGIVLNLEKKNKVLENYGYSLSTKYLDFYFENENKRDKTQINSTDMSWIREEQEDNQELQDIINSIDTSNWNMALLQLISLSITNAIDSQTGEFNKVNEETKFRILSNTNRYSFTLNLPKYDLKSGFKLSQKETTLTSNGFIVDEFNEKEYSFFSNIFFSRDIQKTKNLVFLNQDIKEDYELNLDYMLVTNPGSRHMISANIFYEKLHCSNYKKATGFKVEIKLTDDQKEHLENKINKFYEQNRLRASPFENNNLKYSLLNSIDVTSVSSGSEISLETLFDDKINLIAGISYYGKESGMDVKYDINRQGGSIAYIFSNKGIFGIYIDGEVKVFAGLGLEF